MEHEQQQDLAEHEQQQDLAEHEQQQGLDQEHQQALEDWELRQYHQSNLGKHCMRELVRWVRPPRLLIHTIRGCAPGLD